MTCSAMTTTSCSPPDLRRAGECRLGARRCLHIQVLSANRSRKLPAMRTPAALHIRASSAGGAGLAIRATAVVLMTGAISFRMLRAGGSGAQDGVSWTVERGCMMTRATIRMTFLLMALLVPLSATGQVGVSVSVNVPLPPPIVLPAPPEVVVLPDSNVYVVPDVEDDIFFSGGWWWRPWQGRWYRSRYYDRGWAFYRAAPPPFYRHVPPGWRNDYREHRWRGREWHHERIPHAHMQRNWRVWERDGHWQQRHPGVDRGPHGPGPVPPRGPGAMHMRGPAPMHHPEPGAGRAFQPGPQGPRPGGPSGGGPGRGHGPSHDHRGDHGRR
jgi:hypothetical protein